jgi:hypothetical protein
MADRRLGRYRCTFAQQWIHANRNVRRQLRSDYVSRFNGSDHSRVDHFRELELACKIVQTFTCKLVV